MGLTKTAKWYKSGLVVTNGQSTKASGPLYPELLDAIGDEPVIERAVDFNSFLDEAFNGGRPGRGAPESRCRRHRHRRLRAADTVLGGLHEGYRVHVAVDASASLSTEAHNAALQRTIRAGAVPVTWFSLAAEFQLQPKFHDATHRLR